MRSVIIRNATGYTPNYGEQLRHFENALGYLVGWDLATNKFTYVEVSIHSNGDIAAAYHPVGPTIGITVAISLPVYFLMAQRGSDDTYSFHS